MGKFYELFEMDAHVGAKELDLQYMKVYASFLRLFLFYFNLFFYFNEGIF